MKHVISPEFRVSYPNIFEPKLNQLSKKLEFSMVALFKKGQDIKSLEEKVLEALKEKWGEGKITKTGNQYQYTNAKSTFNIRLPFRDQGDRIKDGNLPGGHEAGAIYLNLKSNKKPGLVDQTLQDIIDPNMFYAGCYARAALTPFAYDQAGNKGVSFGLGAVQKVKEGEPLGNKIDPHTAFEPIADLPQEGASSLFS